MWDSAPGWPGYVRAHDALPPHRGGRPRVPAGGSAGGPISRLAGHDWLVGPAGADPSSDTGRLLAGTVPRLAAGVFPSEKAAWVAAAEGEGLSPAVHHLVTRELSPGSARAGGGGGDTGRPLLVRQHAESRPALRRRQQCLRRFLATPDAMLVMARGDGSVPASRFRRRFT